MGTMTERQITTNEEEEDDGSGEEKGAFLLNGGERDQHQPPPAYFLLHNSPIITHSDYDLPMSSSESSPGWMQKTSPHSSTNTSDPDLLKKLARKAAAQVVAVIGTPVPSGANSFIAEDEKIRNAGEETVKNQPVTTIQPVTVIQPVTTIHPAAANRSIITKADVEPSRDNTDPPREKATSNNDTSLSKNKRPQSNANGRPKGPVVFAPTPENGRRPMACNEKSGIIENNHIPSNNEGREIEKDHAPSNPPPVRTRKAASVCGNGDPIIAAVAAYSSERQTSGDSDWNVKDSFSAKDHHAALQNRYSRTRRRHFTDPVDFEGILRIIGGCGWWQIWVYFLISLEQVPHAMFNLSVMYMMFKPDHWCYVEALDKTKHDDFSDWSSDQIRNTVAPIRWDEANHRYKHEECRMYNRPNYRDLSHMPYENASVFIAADPNVSTVSCHSWMYDTSVMEETIVTQWNLVCENNFHRADAQLAYAVGYLIGCFVSGLSSDRFGRKPTVIGFGVLASMLGMILPYSTYFPMFLLIRFLSAVCNEAADLAAYVLCMEITGNKHRGMVGSLMQVPWAVGYTLLALIAYWVRSWRTIQIISSALHTVTVLLVCVLPESPRWLIVNNRVREAEAIIRKACRMNKSTLPADLELVKHAEQRKWVKRNERANLLHLLKSRELITRTLIVFVVWIATALVYYGITLNLSDQSAPGGKMFSGNFFVNNAVAGAVEIPTLLACIFLLKWGRKRSQMATLILSGLMMLGVVLSPSKPGAFRLVFMLLGKVFIQAAFNILYIFTSELYPTVIRNSAVGVCSMVARMGAGVASYVAILSDITLPIVPMIIFGVFSLVAGSVVLFLPETRDQPLPDTLQDAVIFLKPDRYPYCALPSGFGFNQTKLSSGEGNASASRKDQAEGTSLNPAGTVEA